MPIRSPTITDFLTDGSLAALCQALARMSGARVSLHDDQGRRIIHTGGDPPWRMGNAGEPSRRIAQALVGTGASPTLIPSDGRLLQPLHVGGHIVGALVVDAQRSGLSPETLSHLRDAATYLAMAVDELFEADVAIARRHAELAALFRLSSLLVAATDLQEVLDVALRSAAEILGVEAGLIHLIEDDPSSAPLRASFGFGAGEHLPLGHPLALDDADGQANDLGASIRAAGFDGIVRGGLAFRNKPLGAIHLLSRAPRLLDGDEQALLQTMNEQISAAVASARLLEVQRKSRQVERQLKLAGAVQRRMLPRDVPELSGIEAAARYVPSFHLGGDFYDLLELGGHLGLLVGDVAGKDVPAAMLMASVRATFRAHADEVYHLDQLMARVNRAMVRDTLPNEFATVFYGVIDPVARKLTYCSAGHDPTLIVRRSSSGGRAIVPLDLGGPIIGIDEESLYERHVVDLLPGDVIVAYSDGVIDARNFEQERYGRERFKQALVTLFEDRPESSAQDVVDHIVWEVRRFVGLNPAADDLTLVVARLGE